MDTNILKSALFGYSKMSVSEYIADMNDRFNSRLLAAEEIRKRDIGELREQLIATEKELEKYKKLHAEACAALAEAKEQYHDSIMAHDAAMEILKSGIEGLFREARAGFSESIDRQAEA